jgi:hypothetical protein
MEFRRTDEIAPFVLIIHDANPGPKTVTKHIPLAPVTVPVFGTSAVSTIYSSRLTPAAPSVRDAP